MQTFSENKQTTNTRDFFEMIVRYINVHLLLLLTIDFILHYFNASG